jgi:hypothetical protein
MPIENNVSETAISMRVRLGVSSIIENYPSSLRARVIHYNSHAIFDRLEFFTPRCQLCQMFIGHRFVWSMLQKEFEIPIDISVMSFGYFNHCVSDGTGILTQITGGSGK